eukprot:CAMPEP_0183825134 /NCGR_PEP_ID=MMETSP0807_2-20130328/966_1 /TAXON_ID=88271 /ORGANISM="Picocystis salinarum, Strain CCMP1897" /LENGTH=49 /DNA_ID= /DNA_START= /DNA_END= /DNA_ORIENTATION=
MAKPVCMKNVLDACAGALAYYVTGWAFAYLVFFMQTGFAMLCAGSVRTK